MKTASLVATLLAVSVLAGTPLQAVEQGRHGAGPETEPPVLDLPVARVSLDEAVAKVRRRYEGKILRAETRVRDGRAIHHIKLLTPDGRVRTIRVDAETGRILG